MKQRDKIKKIRCEWEQWTRKILQREKLRKWDIKSSKQRGEGLIQFSIKRILCSKGNYALFLHEVSHALLGKRYWNRYNLGHGVKWADTFTTLCTKYLYYLKNK